MTYTTYSELEGVNSLAERTVSLVKTYQVGGQSPILVLTIPKEVREELRIKKGLKFYVKIDAEGRIIYEPLERAETERKE